MKIQSIDAAVDGSGWDAVVELRGIVFCAVYCNHNISVHLPAYNRRPRVASWMFAHIEKWARIQVTALGNDWHAKHAAVYSKEAA
jgi:hypothetical protein